MIDALRAFARKPSVVYLTIAFMIITIGGSGQTVFGVAYLTRVLKITSGPILGLVSLGGSLLGTLGGGIVVGRLVKRNIAWLIWAPAAGIFAAVPLIVVAYLATAPWVYFLMLFFGLAAIAGTVPALYAAFQVVFGSARRATGFAVMTLLVNVVGTGAGPPLIGALSDVLRASFGPDDALRYALIGCTLTYVPCVLLMWLAGRAVAGDAEE